MFKSKGTRAFISALMLTSPSYAETVDLKLSQSLNLRTSTDAYTDSYLESIATLPKGTVIRINREMLNKPEFLPYGSERKQSQFGFVTGIQIVSIPGRSARRAAELNKQSLYISKSLIDKAKVVSDSSETATAVTTEPGEAMAKRTTANTETFEDFAKRVDDTLRATPAAGTPDAQACIGCGTTVSAPEAASAPLDKTSRTESYKRRYGASTVHEKIVDNHGNGRSSDLLYGTRNTRTILHGIAYRGGANNMFNKNGKRDNQNPLPQEGLSNLCKEGFDGAIYLYATNFGSARKHTQCSDRSGQSNTLSYEQIGPTTSRGQKLILQKVFETIKDPSKGPVYLHCWNGWHASGLASAIILRQLCGVSADAAVSYWNKNTDGANQGANYDKYRGYIRNFSPLKEYQISREQQKQICPSV